MNTDLCFIYITCPSVSMAEQICRTTIEAELAACGNLISGMRSIYRWQGQIEEAQECVLILKTRMALFGKVQSWVKAQHPYDTPCIVALPISAGYDAYLDWLRNETRN